MDCERVRGLFPAYLEDRLSEVARRAVERHVCECRACEEAFGVEADLAGMKALIQRNPPAGLKHRVQWAVPPQAPDQDDECYLLGPQISAWADGQLEADERAVVARHLKSCAACQRLVREMQRMDAMLHALPAHQPSPALLGRIMSRIPRPIAAPQPRITWPSLREVGEFVFAQLSLRPALAVATAALVLVLLSVGLVLRGGGPESEVIAKPAVTPMSSRDAIKSLIDEDATEGPTAFDRMYDERTVAEAGGVAEIVKPRSPATARTARVWGRGAGKAGTAVRVATAPTPVPTMAAPAAPARPSASGYAPTMGNLDTNRTLLAAAALGIDPTRRASAPVAPSVTSTVVYDPAGLEELRVSSEPPRLTLSRPADAAPPEGVIEPAPAPAGPSVAPPSGPATDGSPV